MIKIIKSASKTKNNYIPITYSLSGYDPWFAVFSKSGMRTKSSFSFMPEFNSKSRSRRLSI